MTKYLSLWLAILCVLSLTGCVEEEAEVTAISAKPVIYLYPEEATEISVELDFDGELTSVYPEYEGKWEVIAQPDGTLTDANREEYYCLFWEGISDTEYAFSEGFCVKGEDTADFLEEALDKLGLSRREANEFIIYWLPQMETSPYNLISFQNEIYEEQAKLTIEPAPDTLLRVFMAWKPLTKEVDIELQELTAPERRGFVAVEWGGCRQ